MHFLNAHIKISGIAVEVFVVYTLKLKVDHKKTSLVA